MSDLEEVKDAAAGFWLVQLRDGLGLEPNGKKVVDQLWREFKNLRDLLDDAINVAEHERARALAVTDAFDVLCDGRKEARAAVRDLRGFIAASFPQADPAHTCDIVHCRDAAAGTFLADTAHFEKDRK